MRTCLVNQIQFRKQAASSKTRSVLWRMHLKVLMSSSAAFRWNHLVTPIYKPFRPFGREQPYLGDLLTMVINHLLTGIILQVSISTTGNPYGHKPRTKSLFGEILGNKNTFIIRGSVCSQEGKISFRVTVNYCHGRNLNLR